jgi:hypothetical protein
MAGPLGRGGAVGDLDHSGIPDVALIAPGAEVMTLLIGGATPWNYAPTTVSLSGRAPRQVAVSDFDGDGWSDVAVTARNALLVFFNAGNGSLETGNPAVVDLTGVVDPDALAVGDLNADGKPDILLGALASGATTVVFNTGNRTFQRVLLAGTAVPGAVAIGDVDSDGLLDAVVVRPLTAELAVYRQRSSHAGLADALAPPTVYATGAVPSGVVVVDVDGDHRNDAVITSRGEDALEVFVQR